MHYLFLVLSWTLFYILHSSFAGAKLKRFFTAKIGLSLKSYRLFYSIGSSLFIFGILVQSMLIPSLPLFSKGPFTAYLAYVFAGFGTIILVKSMKQISISSFLGISSMTEKSDKLIITGMYSKIRHPLYAGLLLIFIGYLLYAGTLAAAVHLGCLMAYLPFGIYFEEKNLLAIYGQDYRNYQEKVPPILPWI